VVKLADAASLASPELAEDQAADSSGPRPGFTSVIVRARHRPAKELSEAISKVLSKPAGSATALGDGNLIIIADLTDREDQALRLLELLDVAGSSALVEEVAVRNLPPAQLASAAMQLSTKRDAVSGDKTPGEVLPSPNGNAVLLIAPAATRTSWRELISSLDQREPFETVTYSPRYFAAKDVARLADQTVRDPSDDRWRLVVDELTGSLVITATPTQHQAIAALLERLAAAPVEARRPVRTFVIRNRPVREIQSVLEELLQAGVIEAAAESPADSAQASISAPERGTPTPMPPVPVGGAGASSASIAGSAATSSSSVPARKRESGGATRASSNHSPSTPDRPLTLSSDGATNTLMAVGEPRLLAQIEALLKTLDVRQPQVMLEVLMVTLSESQSLDLGVELDTLIKSGDVRVRLSSLFGLSKRGADGLNPGDPTGFTGVVLSPGDFASVIRALQTINRGRSLSMPKLLVGNNQSASLDSVVQQPYASVNASTTVSTTSYGGSQDAGTTVTIKPQIAEGDHLLLDYSVSLSSFLGSAAAATLPPPKQQNKVQSAATIPDGYTVVVGGIELENESKSVSQVPLLGSIPLIGEAFKTRTSSSTKTRFFVFIRANILRNRGFEDLKYLSDRDAARAAVDDGLPKVEPRVIK
jgi:general secretion pathway protein D